MFKIIIILLLSIPIFQYRVFWFLVDVIGIGYAYVVDQFLPLISTSVVAFVVIKKYAPISVVKKYIAIHRTPILLIVVTTLVVHGLMLGNYFMGEEPNTILFSINNDDREKFVSGILRGYHYGTYVLSYQLFFTKAALYNVVALVLYIFTAIMLYVFLNLLFNKKVIPALIGTLFFVTTPAYMDMFFWQSNVSGMPIALSAGILSLIFLYVYQKNNKFLYYVISIMFYLSMLKIGFVRLHAFIALPLYMCFLPLSLRFSRPDLKRFVLLALPFLGILLSYLLTVFILPDHVIERFFPALFPGSGYSGPAITVRGATLNTENYLAVLSMFVAYLFIPSKFVENYYPYIIKFFPTRDISLTFLFGALSIIMLAITGIIALRYIRQIWGRLTIFALLIIFAHLVFTPLLIQGYGNLVLMDDRFSNTGPSNGPGIRYVFVSAMGLSLLVGVMAYGILVKSRKYRVAFFTFMFLLFGYYTYLNITSYVSALKNIHPGQSRVADSVFSMVPKDGNNKLLYSTNPKYNTVEAKIGDWLHAFYKLDELTYTNSLEDVRKNIASGMYQKNDFYAFYNNTITQSFKDVSTLARSELFENRINEETIQIAQNTDLTTSFIGTENSSFPFVLKRGIYSSREFNLRLLSTRELSISIHKTELSKRYPYVDAFVVENDKTWRGSLFPMGIWDMLKNKPVFVNINQLNLALSVSSLKKTIDKLSFESRIKIARDLKHREISKDDPDIIISDVEKINKHYVDNKLILNSFLEIPSFNSLALVYACAEDEDWEKQQKSSETIGGMWYVKEFPLNNNKPDEEISTSFTCFGSTLRKLILIGPPTPSKIIIDNISLH